MLRKPDMMKQFYDFKNLPAADRIEIQIKWLESRMIAVLRLISFISSLLAGQLSVDVIRDVFDTHSPWHLISTFAVAFISVAWLSERNLFKGAPPHIVLYDRYD